MMAGPSRDMSRRLGDPLQTSQRGFTLVEILVGLLIATLTTVIMANLFTVMDSHRRTLTSTGESVMSGGLALHMIQATLREAGNNINSALLIGCNLDLNNGSVLSGLAPVTINHPQVPQGDANSDTLLVVAGSGTGSPEGYLIGGVSVNHLYRVFDFPQHPERFFSAPIGNQQQYVIATTNATCSILSANLLLDTVDDPSHQTVSVSGKNYEFLRLKAGYAAGKNQTGGKLFDLGWHPLIIGYAVRGGNLTRCNYITQPACARDASKWETVMPHVVAMKFQYGVDQSNPADGVVDLPYTTTAPSGFSSMAACNWSRVQTVRVALAVRGAQPEKSPPQHSDTSVSWAGFDLSETSPDWSLYHYRFVQGIVPLRSVMAGVAGCNGLGI